MARKRHRIAQKAWHAEDRQSFSDGNILRAQTIPNKKRLADRKACRDFRWQP
jgi:hypothetical protein